MNTKVKNNSINDLQKRVKRSAKKQLFVRQFLKDVFKK